MYLNGSNRRSPDFLKSPRPRQVSLKKTLGTKVLAEANSRAKPVLMEFDRTLPPLRLLRAQAA